MQETDFTKPGMGDFISFDTSGFAFFGISVKRSAANLGKILTVCRVPLYLQMSTINILCIKVNRLYATLFVFLRWH